MGCFSENHFNEINKITNVSRETFSLLEIFAVNILKWNKSINLISKSQMSYDDIWQRHILDSAQIVKYIPSDTKVITDFGSGGGLPGVVLAIMGDWRVNMIESDERKCAFLNQMAAILKRNIKVHNERIEDMEAWESDVLTARAFAPLDKLLEWTNSFVEKSQLCVFLKGESVVEEIKEASKSWDIEYKIHPSITSEDGRILKILNATQR